MVKKTYRLCPEDAQRLVLMACRYRSMKTVINEASDTMHVDSTFGNTEKPTSIANSFKLLVVSDEPPKMPRGEHDARVRGEFPERAP